MNRRVALASIAVVVVLCLVGVSIAAVAAGGTALAYEVNGTRLSQHDFDGQLDDVAHAEVTKEASHSGGSIDSRVAAQVMTTNIVVQLLRDAAAKQNVEVTSAERDQARETIGNQLDAYPASYRDLQIDLQAHLVALGLETEDEVGEFLNRAVARADVRVDPRYGFWNPRFGVCPPTGCSVAG